MASTFKEQLSKLGALPLPQKILMAGIVGVAVAGFLFLLYSLQKPSYMLLYSGLTSEDAASIVEDLKKDRVPYEMTAGGENIMVPADKVYDIRMSLAGKGLPQNGVGFEIFDKVSIGTTEFVQKMNYRRALQGELARTISQLDSVERTRVHISLPDETVFIEDEKPSTASVFLNLKPGVKLHSKQIQGIAYLVSGAVEGLTSENVTIMDTGGKILNGPKEEGMTDGLSSSQMEYELGIEKNLEKNIQTMLEKVIGKEKVIARVSASLNLKQVQKTEEIYDPNITAVRSEQTSKEKTSGQSGSGYGVPGVASNVPGKGGGGKTNTSQSQNETINYEINKVTRHVVEPVGTIEKLSVAVLVDGIYEVNEGSEAREYVPRTPEEMKKYETLVKGVIGFDETRGDSVHVENIPFKVDSGENWFEGNDNGGIISPMMIVVLRYLMTALFGILFVLFFIKPLMKWITSTSGGDVYPATVAELESALSGNMLTGISATKQQEFKEEIQKLVQDNPAMATSLIKNWLNERR